MTLHQLHRLSQTRNQPILVQHADWGEFKALIVITPNGRWWIKRKDGSRFEARFTHPEWKSRKWIEVLLCESLQADGSGNTPETATAPL